MNSLSLPYPIIIALIIVAAIGTIAAIIKILKNKDSSEKLHPKEIQSDENEIKSKEESKSELLTKKSKMSYGKIWSWIIPTLIISAIVGAILTVPKYYNKNGIAKSTASYSWKKKSHQYGCNSNERFGGPYDTVITKDDGSNFCFTVYGGESDTHFYGKNKNGKIEGWWKQSNPRAGGKWDLKKDAYDPALYTGICTDPYLPDGTDIELRLKY